MKKLFSVALLMSIIAFGIFSCSEDITSGKSEDLKPGKELIADDVLFKIATIDEAKSLYQNRRASSGGFWASIEPQWDKAKKSRSKKGEFLVVPTKHKPITSYLFIDETRDLQYTTSPLELVVYKDRADKLLSLYLLRIPVLDSTGKRLSPLDTKSFSGRLMYYDMSGKVISNRYLVNGKSESNAGGRNGRTSGCGLAYHCFYSSPGNGLDGEAGDVIGTSIWTWGNCPPNLSRPGRFFSLVSYDESYTCLDEDEGGYPTPPHDDEPAPPTGGTGVGSVGSIAASEYDNLLEDLDNDGDKFQVIINNLCQGDDFRTYIHAQEIAIAEFESARDACLREGGYSQGAVEAIRQGVTLRALWNLLIGQALTIAQKRDLRFTVWMMSIGNLVAANCIDDAYSIWQAKMGEARSTFKVNYNIHANSINCN